MYRVINSSTNSYEYRGYTITYKDGRWYYTEYDNHGHQTFHWFSTDKDAEEDIDELLDTPDNIEASIEIDIANKINTPDSCYWKWFKDVGRFGTTIEVFQLLDGDDVVYEFDVSLYDYDEDEEINLSELKDDIVDQINIDLKDFDLQDHKNGNTLYSGF